MSWDWFEDKIIRPVWYATGLGGAHDLVNDSALREDIYAKALPGAGGGETSLASFVEGLDRIVTGRVGDYNADQGQWNPSWGDAGRQTAGVFLPDYIYRPPAVTGAQGSDGSGDILPQGIVPDAWEDTLKNLGTWGLVAGVVILAMMGNRKP